MSSQLLLSPPICLKGLVCSDTPCSVLSVHCVKCGPLALQELPNRPTCTSFGLVPASVQEGSLQPTGLGQSVSSVNQTSGWHVTRWTHGWREGPLVSDSVRV